MTTLMNYGPIGLAIICYVLAGLFKADPGTHDGLLVLAGSLVGWAIPRLGDMFRRPDKLGSPSPKTTVVCLLALGSLLLVGSAHAQAKAPQALG